MIIVTHLFHLFFFSQLAHFDSVLNRWVRERLDVDQEEAGTLARELDHLSSNCIHKSADTLVGLIVSGYVCEDTPKHIRVDLFHLLLIMDITLFEVFVVSRLLTFFVGKSCILSCPIEC